MYKDFSDLKPQSVWKYFFALAAIPRPSGSEEGVAQYVIAEAKRLGLESSRDDAGNVVVRKPATPGKEASPTTVLQGHMDMVCEKNREIVHDFTRDPIAIVRDGDYLKAKGTTLGADNGLGCAAALALLESKDIPHPALECLFTIDEETGLTGAFQLSPTILAGRVMLNLDTEEEGSVYIGCAGGLDTVLKTTVKLLPFPKAKKPFRISVTGLCGGHSGVDIHVGRVNALRVLGRILHELIPSVELDVVSVSGGNKRNAIPREAFAEVALGEALAGKVTAELERIQAEIRAEVRAIDPGAKLTLEPSDNVSSSVFDPKDALRIARFLHGCLHGVLAMSPDIPGLVQTSTNLATLKTEGETVEAVTTQRSSLSASKQDAGRMVAALAELAGFTVEHGNGYPGWAPNVSSPLLKKATSIYTEMFGRAPEIKAVHAGLECGIIGEKYPGMDTISFGPTIQGAHSPDERVHIASVEEFWKYLVGILAAL